MHWRWVSSNDEIYLNGLPELPDTPACVLASDLLAPVNTAVNTERRECEKAACELKIRSVWSRKTCTSCSWPSWIWTALNLALYIQTGPLGQTGKYLFVLPQLTVPYSTNLELYQLYSTILITGSVNSQQFPALSWVFKPYHDLILAHKNPSQINADLVEGIQREIYWAVKHQGPKSQR